MKGYSDDEIIRMISNEGLERETAIRFLMEEERRSKRLASQLLKSGATAEECEEIVDDAFVALIMSISRGSFQTGGNLWGYLYGTAKNILWKVQRQKRKRTVISDDTIQIEDAEDSIEEEIIRDEHRAWLLAVLRTLPDKCQRILHLAFFRERTNQEIADALEYKTKAVVGVKKSECLKALAQRIREARSKNA